MVSVGPSANSQLESGTGILPMRFSPGIHGLEGRATEFFNRLLVRLSYICRLLMFKGARWLRVFE